MVTPAEYWIGEGVDYRGVWDAFLKGTSYIEKYNSMTVHLLRIEFNSVDERAPLFNHEAIYKTIKGYFHDLKFLTLPRREYERAGPLFLYSIERGSEIWNFLGELRQLITLGTTLADEKVIGQRLENVDKRLQILGKYFGNAVDPEAFRAFMRASTPEEIEFAMNHLIDQGLRRVQLSQEAFKGDIRNTEKSLVDLTKIVKKDGD